MQQRVLGGQDELLRGLPRCLPGSGSLWRLRESVPDSGRRKRDLCEWRVRNRLRRRAVSVWGRVPRNRARRRELRRVRPRLRGARDGGATCAEGSCGLACNAGYEECAALAATCSADDQHCGTAADTRARRVRFAALENARSSCANGEVECGGACVNTAQDTSHCGACGTVCPACRMHRRFARAAAVISSARERTSNAPGLARTPRTTRAAAGRATRNARRRRNATASCRCRASARTLVQRGVFPVR